MSGELPRQWSLWPPEQHLAEAQRLVAEQIAEEEGGRQIIYTITPTRLTIAAMHVEMAKVQRINRATETLRQAIIHAGLARGGR